MSDYSNTHWMKDAPENFHCKPDKPYMENKLGPPKDMSSIVFRPEKLLVEKNLLRNIKDCLQSGLEHTNATLVEHDSALGRTTRKNKSWAETLEKDIRNLETCMEEVDKILVVGETHYP